MEPVNIMALVDFVDNGNSTFPSITGMLQHLSPQINARFQEALDQLHSTPGRIAGLMWQKGVHVPLRTDSEGVERYRHRVKDAMLALFDTLDFETSQYCAIAEMFIMLNAYFAGCEFICTDKNIQLPLGIHWPPHPDHPVEAAFLSLRVQDQARPKNKSSRRRSKRV